jgi:Zn-dependent protease
LSRNAIILLAAWIALGAALAMMKPAPGYMIFLFVVVGWIVALTAHEFGHAFVAHLGGDTTVEGRGYLTLDPLKYTDIGVSLVIPLLALALGGIGFPGGAVYLRQDLMRSPLWRSAASLAGPLGTFLALVVLAAALPWVGRLNGGEALAQGLAVLAFLQATALVLNLLPIPGLDGWGVIRPFLPESLLGSIRVFERFGFVVLFALIFFVPGAAQVLFGVALAVTDDFAIPRALIADGWAGFGFWR